MVGEPVLSTGMAYYHLPTEVHISHPPSNNFDVLHCQLLDFNSRQACRGVPVGIRKGKESGQRAEFSYLWSIAAAIKIPYLEFL